MIVGTLFGYKKETRRSIIGVKVCARDLVREEPPSGSTAVDRLTWGSWVLRRSLKCTTTVWTWHGRKFAVVVIVDVGVVCPS